jgi:hypothetical protein
MLGGSFFQRRYSGVAIGLGERIHGTSEYAKERDHVDMEMRDHHSQQTSHIEGIKYSRGAHQTTFVCRDNYHALSLAAHAMSSAPRRPPLRSFACAAAVVCLLRPNANANAHERNPDCLHAA